MWSKSKAVNSIILTGMIPCDEKVKPECWHLANAGTIITSCACRGAWNWHPNWPWCCAGSLKLTSKRYIRHHMPLLMRGFTFSLPNDWALSFQLPNWIIEFTGTKRSQEMSWYAFDFTWLQYVIFQITLWKQCYTRTRQIQQIQWWRTIGWWPIVLKRGY
jgi:hypothetical protein